MTESRENAARPQLRVVDDAPLPRGERRRRRSSGESAVSAIPARAGSPRREGHRSRSPAQDRREPCNETRRVCYITVPKSSPNRRSRRRAAGRRPDPARHRGTARPAPAPAAGANPARRHRRHEHRPRASGSAGARRRPPSPAGAAARPRTATRDTRQFLARAHHHLVRRGRRAQHVQRLGRLHAEPAPLADGEVLEARDATPAPRRRTTRSRPARRPAPRGGRGSAPCPCPARKQRSWESARLATGSSADAASARTSGLVSSASGNRMRAKRRRRQRGEHVRLVLRRVGGDAQQPVGGHARVVPRGQETARRDDEANASISSSRTCPLQPTHGFGVSPAA